MKLRFIAFVCSVLLWCNGYTQTITAAEYYIDNDPGMGNATPFTITPGDSVTGSFTLTPSGLSLGIHELYTRYQYSNGTWSFAEPVSFVANYMVDSSVKIDGYEYYFDNDPGQGKGTFVSIIKADSSTFTDNISATGLSTYAREVFYRFHYTDGQWGFPESNAFFGKETGSDTSVHIIGYEFFYDNDPGIGFGTYTSLTPADSIDHNFSIATGGQGEGIHDAYIRYALSTGGWSFPENNFFLIRDDRVNIFSPLVELQYFIDNADSSAMGKNKTITFSPNPADSIGLTVDIALDSMDSGLHTFTIRAINTGGIISIDSSGNFTYNVVTAIESINQDLSTIQMYPNPASDYINVANAKGVIQIMNINGQLMQTDKVTSDNTRIDITNLPAGLYILKTISNDNCSLKKFIKK